MAWTRMPEPVARALATTLGGEPVACRPVEGLRESGAGLWRVEAPASEAFLLRCFGPGRGFRQAQMAQVAWGAGGRVAPEVVAQWPEHRAWLERWIEGVGPAPPVEVARAVCSLHALRVTANDPVTLRRAWQKRCRAAVERSQGRVPEALRLRAAERLASIGPGPQTARVPCHRDLHPGNWLWDGHQAWLVDFEHARLDWAAVDWAALERGLAASAERVPSCENNPLPEREQLDAAHLLWALQTAARAPSLRAAGLGPRVEQALGMLRSGGWTGRPRRLSRG